MITNEKHTMKNRKSRLKIIVSCLLIGFNSFSQNVSINTTGAVADPSAGLDIDFTDKGILLPRVALSALNSDAPIGPSVATSLLVYNTASAGLGVNAVVPGYYYWTGAAWTRINTSPSAGWDLLGNIGTNPATHFLGTQDATDLVVRTTNTERLRVSAAGFLGLGVTNPFYRLDISDRMRIRQNGGNTAGIWFDGTAGVESSFLGTINNTYFGIFGNGFGNWTHVFNVNNGFTGIGTLAPITKLHVVGDGDNLPIIYGVNTNTTAGTTSYGVRGECGSSGLGSAGVSGVSTNSSQNEIGVLGDYSLWGASLFGLAWASSYADMPSSRDFGVFATCNFSTGTGVYARDMNNSIGSNAFYGTGKFVVTGAKSASIPTTKGNQLVYCIESPEIWFEDFGQGKLVNGSLHVSLEGIFNEAIFADAEHPIHVFVQEQGQSNGLFVVVDADFKGFTVTEKFYGNSDISFSYRITGKRRFYQDFKYGVDSNQPFGDNLKDAKYMPPIPQDPKVMEQFVKEETAKKEVLIRKR
jgi:hypothetical protein